MLFFQELIVVLASRQVSTANVDTLSRGMNHSLSYSSSCISDFFDAREYSTDHDGDLANSDTDEEDTEEEEGGETGASDDDTEDDTEDDQVS